MGFWISEIQAINSSAGIFVLTDILFFFMKSTLRGGGGEGSDT